MQYVRVNQHCEHCDYHCLSQTNKLVIWTFNWILHKGSLLRLQKSYVSTQSIIFLLCVYQYFIHTSSYRSLISIFLKFSAFLTLISNLVFIHSVTYSFISFIHSQMIPLLKIKKIQSDIFLLKHQISEWTSISAHILYLYSRWNQQSPSCMIWILKTNSRLCSYSYGLSIVSLPLPSHLNHSSKINHALKAPILKPTTQLSLILYPSADTVLSYLTVRIEWVLPRFLH